MCCTDLRWTHACRLLMFHGPIKEAVPFFESMGFRCPERKDHASFLQEVTTPKGKLLNFSLPSQACVLPCTLMEVMPLASGPEILSPASWWQSEPLA